MNLISKKLLIQLKTKQGTSNTITLIFGTNSSESGEEQDCHIEEEDGYDIESIYSLLLTSLAKFLFIEDYKYKYISFFPHSRHFF